MDIVDRMLEENGIKRPNNLFYYLIKGVILVSLDCKEWFTLVFNEGLTDIVPFSTKNRVPYELGVALGFYDTHTPIMP